MPRRERSNQNAALIIKGGTVHIGSVNNTNIVVQGGKVPIDAVHNHFAGPTADDASEEDDQLLADPGGFLPSPDAPVLDDNGGVDIEDFIAAGPLGTAPLKEVMKIPAHWTRRAGRDGGADGSPPKSRNP